MVTKIFRRSGGKLKHHKVMLVGAIPKIFLSCE